LEKLDKPGNIHSLKQQEGYLKFECRLTEEESSIPPEFFGPLNFWRKMLWDKQLIGVYIDGIGYGNISVRLGSSDQFYISGTATGGIPELSSDHYSLVEECDPGRNFIRCRGRIRASAESMSHAAIYASSPDACAVVHVHNLRMWDRYLGILPTTDPAVEYGTPDMAAEISRVMQLPETLSGKVLVMGGHREGLISFGKTLEEAVKVMLERI
jgi:ribulose-5-phosphate 4-epimerase/fuculose-1-phosphate aldolase